MENEVRQRRKHDKNGEKQRDTQREVNVTPRERQKETTRTERGRDMSSEVQDMTRTLGSARQKAAACPSQSNATLLNYQERDKGKTAKGRQNRDEGRSKRTTREKV